jgi:hypothetical protein
MTGPDLGAHRFDHGLDVSRGHPGARPIPPAAPVRITVRPDSFTPTLRRICQMN